MRGGVEEWRSRGGKDRAILRFLDEAEGGFEVDVAESEKSVGSLQNIYTFVVHSMRNHRRPFFVGSPFGLE
jgi:hypothetical protein